MGGDDGSLGATGFVGPELNLQHRVLIKAQSAHKGKSVVFANSSHPPAGYA